MLKAVLSIGISIQIAVLATAACCFAESSESPESLNTGFFNRGSVIDMSIPLGETEQPEIQYGTTKGIPGERLLPSEVVSVTAEPSAELKTAQNGRIPEGVDAVEYSLKQEFGDPKEPVSIKGIDNAPKPYKAMLKAIDMGRDDLALQYANQWMGYMKSLDRITRKANSMASVVKLDPETAESKITEQAFANIDPVALSGYLEKRKAEHSSNEIKDDVVIDAQSREVIDAFFGETSTENSQSVLGRQAIKDPYSKLVDTTIDPVSRKALIRAELASKVPVDPAGNVQVMFFLKPSEQSSIEVAKQITDTLSSPTLGVSLGVVPLSVEGVSLENNKRFFDGSGMPASLRDGLALSRSLNISQFPALLFITPNSEKAFLKTGKADAVFIEEVARMIGGK